MFQRFKDILCHPSRLGLYLVDKWRVCFGYFAFFFLVTIGLIMTVDLNAKIFTYSDAKEITNALICESSLANSGYDGEKLYGPTTKLQTENFLIYFDETAYRSTISASDIIIVLSDDSASIYFGSVRLSYIDYKSFQDAWSIEKINAGNPGMRVLMTDFIYDIIVTANSGYRGVLIADDIVSTIIYWAVSFGVCLVVAFFVNPMVERRYRYKLCMYTSLIFFFGIWLDVLYAQSFFLYIALVLPMIYTFIALSRIRRVEVKRRDSNDNNRGH